MCLLASLLAVSDEAVGLSEVFETVIFSARSAMTLKTLGGSAAFEDFLSPLRSKKLPISEKSAMICGATASVLLRLGLFQTVLQVAMAEIGLGQ